MEKSTKIWIGVIIVIALIVITGIYFTSLTRNAIPNESDTIKIGFTGILSGDASTWGQSGLAGATLAVKEINDKGGINGKKVELIVEDDQLSPVKSVNSFNKLINIDKVTAIISIDASSPTASSVPIAQTSGVPVIIAGASAPKLTLVGDYIFRVMPSDDFQGKYAAEYIYNTLGKKKTALLYVNNDWGVGIKGVFEKRYKELGGEIVYQNSFSQDENDFKTQFSQVKQKDAEIIYYLAYPDNALAGFKQLKEMDLNIPVICGDAINDESVLNSQYADGIIFSTAKVNSPEEFRAKLNSLAGFENLKSNIAGPTGYDATKILLNTIKKVGTDETEIREELVKTKYYGISNPVIEFDENRELKDANAEVLIIRNKEAVSLS